MVADFSRTVLHSRAFGGIFQDWFVFFFRGFLWAGPGYLQGHLRKVSMAVGLMEELAVVNTGDHVGCFYFSLTWINCHRKEETCYWKNQNGF